MKLLLMRKTYAALGVVFVAVSAITWWKLTRVSFENQPVEFTIRQSVHKLSTLKYARPASLEEVRELLSNHLHITGLQPGAVDHIYTLAPTRLTADSTARVNAAISQDQVEQLVDQLSEIIYYRLLGDSPDAYLDSRKRWGNIAPDDAGLKARNWDSLETIYRFLHDRPRSESDTLEGFLRETFNNWIPSTGGIRGITIDPVGLAMTVGLIDRNKAASASLDSTNLGVLGWFGAESEPGGVFLFPPQTVDELLDRYTALPYAEAGIVVDYKGAAPQPIVFQFLWNPDTGYWFLDNVLFSNRRNMNAKELPHF